MNEALAAELETLVREGNGLRQSIVATGLPLKATLLDLRKNHREQFRKAKREQVIKKPEAEDGR